MFSVFKKLAAKNDNPVGAGIGSAGVPESVGQQMSDSLRKKFSRGVQYNMKVIIKGDRNVGKSCLLERLQGKAFLEQYNPTEQIQVASIQWSFKATDDIVKVEVWDVVDRGKSKQKTSVLKLNTDSQVEDIPVLDAEFLDVYKGTHCVIMMMDITKAWTFDYVCRELPKVPAEIPVLLLGNHCDMGHHRVVSKDQIQGFIEELSQTRSAEIVYGDSSMRNGFGLRLLHKFFGIPFLYLQKSALEASLKKNEQDADICRLEIDEFLKSDESNYTTFLESLISRKKAKETTSPHQQSASAPNTPLEVLPRPTKSIILGGGHPIIVPDKNSHLAVASTSTVNTAKLVSPAAKLAASTPTKVSPGVEALRIPKSATMGSMLSEGKSGNGFVALGSPGGGKISNVDEFCPDGGMLDKSFLEDASDVAAGLPESNAVLESESEDENHHNPLVSRFDDDLGGDGADQPQLVQSQLPRPTSFQSPITKVNPLRQDSLTPSPNPAVIDRAFSLSSIELEIDRMDASGEKPRQVAVDADGSLNDSESWTPDTKERRSPEGGEDVGSNVSVACLNSSGSGSGKKSKDKDKDRERTSKHKKSKKSSREKDESKEERRRSKRKSHVDEFVHEMKSSAEYCEDAYEAI
ncbi:rab-like protein 6 [Toxorhynchites rutilus septentrionalis]|uniref:rab-like protein 6 n=1 Tax=Toxorhynchites rutilus septentrionalis TaxID=329112 RepID=UPI00247B06DD|nr:rab-like protein 6 [Toxorhynchites rutilus septentrionalis]